MSYTHAWALAREVPDTELRPKLIAAYETLIEVAGAVPYAPSALSDELAGHVTAALKTAEEADEEAEQRIQEAEARLEEHLQDKADETLTERIGKLTEQVATLTAERDALQARLDSAKTLVEAHADLVAMARRFTSAAVSAGVPIKHARAVRKKAG